MKKILVIGDVMLDVYINGFVERISPEGPIPVFLSKGEKKFVPGGAANVAMNVKAAGCYVGICGVIGDDLAGKDLAKTLSKQGIQIDFLYKCNRTTTTKTRYVGQNNQQILRVDNETKEDVSLDEVRELLDILSKSIHQFDAVILSDYKKGFLSKEITLSLIKLIKGKNIPIFVDVKDMDYLKYKGVTLIKPNRKELCDLTKMSVKTIDDVIKASTFLCKETDSEYVLTTLGAEGMILVNKDTELLYEKTKAKEVFDVTGAGDTTIAYIAAEMAGGKSIKTAVRVANAAAGIQVSKLGTSVVYSSEVKRFLSKKGDINKKIINDSFEKWIGDLEQLKSKGKTIVFTNGCFDILHAGHISYLSKAKELGDYLIVAVNTDESVKKLKGDDRPINSLEDRMLLLSALTSVDYVIAFSDDTPLELINKVRPSVLVKGGDYKVEDIVGADEVIAYGGRVEIIDYVPGKSTTNIINKSKNAL